MFIIPTKTRFKSQTTHDAPRAIVRGGKSHAEIAALGERMGYVDRELSANEVRELTSSEYLWFETLFPARLEYAAQIEANKQRNKEVRPILEARRMWGGHSSPEEDEKARVAGDQFATRFPRFERTFENAETMVTYMQEHDLDATKVSSYIAAFRALTEAGKLTVTPEQSASDFYEAHDELHDNRVPPLIAARHVREENTAAHFAKSHSATSEGSVTRIVDYEQQKHGVPPQPDKMSFRKKINSMTAEEIRKECEINPGFRAALDALK